MPDDEQPELVRRSVGRLIRQCREQRGMSQGELAERLSVSYQQVQKYERGSTRLSVERLYQMADALDTAPLDLLPGPGGEVGERKRALKATPAPAGRRDSSEGSAEGRYRLEEEELRLVKLYRKIRNPKLKRVVFSYLKTVSQSDASQSGASRSEEPPR